MLLNVDVRVFNGVYNNSVASLSSIFVYIRGSANLSLFPKEIVYKPRGIFYLFWTPLRSCSWHLVPSMPSWAFELKYLPLTDSG